MIFEVREMKAGDLDAVELIYRRHVPEGVHESWRARVTQALVAPASTVALVGVDQEDQVLGYLVGDVRVWEFGSEPAGWIFALAVDPGISGEGLGRRLQAAARKRFSDLGVARIRTMVRKDDVKVLRFFRDHGFRAGPYVELELDVGPFETPEE